MEKLLLRAFLAGKKLDIVNQQRIHRPVIAFELIDGVQLQCLDHVGHKPFRTQIGYLRARVATHNLIANGMHQVGFTQAHTAIEKQRVVGTTGVFCHLHGGSPGQLVRFTLDKGIEGKGFVKKTLVFDITFYLHRTALGLGLGCRRRHRSWC